MNVMQVKNRFIEQLDEKYRAEIYEYLYDSVPVYAAKKEIASGSNVFDCGDMCLVVKPHGIQSKDCLMRVLPLYGYLPDTKDEAERIAKMTREEGVHWLGCVKEQYSPEEVYDCLMQGLKDGNLYNAFDSDIIEERDNFGLDRHIEIADVYRRGQWVSTSCICTGISEQYCYGIDYSLDRNLKNAMRFFDRHLTGKDKKIFRQLASQKDMEAE